MTKNSIVLALAFAFAACGAGPVDGDDDTTMVPTPDAATPPPAPDAATPPPAEPEGEECRLVGQTSATREGCDACEEAGWRCGPDLEWFCDDAPCVVAPTEDAATPPPAEDAGMMPESDAGTPPPPPSMEDDAGTPPPPPPADLCAGKPPRACEVECVGRGGQACNPTTGEYIDCVITSPITCTDAGPAPAPDAGPTCAPSVEVCDGADNDCDGMIDEADDSGVPLSMECYTGAVGTLRVGACLPGIAYCEHGGWGTCYGEVKPVTEICGNGLDEDCNGADLACAPSPCSDPRIGMACSNGVGACRRDGTFVCSSGAVACSAPAAGTPTTEICGDGIDQDCNGSDLACAPPPPPTSGTRTVYEFRVNDPMWGTVYGHQLRDNDAGAVTCEAPRADRPLEALGTGWFRCIVTGRLTPFVGAFHSPNYASDLWLHTTYGSSSCTATPGVQWRVYSEDIGRPGGPTAPYVVANSPTAPCRHTLP